MQKLYERLETIKLHRGQLENADQYVTLRHGEGVLDREAYARELTRIFELAKDCFGIEDDYVEDLRLRIRDLYNLNEQ
jgi:hypothetical protein